MPQAQDQWVLTLAIGGPLSAHIHDDLLGRFCKPVTDNSQHQVSRWHWTRTTDDAVADEESILRTWDHRPLGKKLGDLLPME